MKYIHTDLPDYTHVVKKPTPSSAGLRSMCVLYLMLCPRDREPI